MPFLLAARLISSAAVLLAVSSCVANRPLRTFDLTGPATRPSPFCADAQARPVPAGCDVQMGTLGDPLPGVCTSIDKLTTPGSEGRTHQEVVSCFSHEHHELTGSEWQRRGFDLHVIELDDHGQLWSPDLVERTYAALRSQLVSDHSVLVTFVHGWKNGPSVCNDNLACFRNMLELMSKAEIARGEAIKQSPRHVVGLFIGWRGGTSNVPVWKNTTFWSRKNTAHTIGDNGAITAVIQRVRVLVDESRPRHSDTPGDSPTTLWIGHSFGAALLFSAISTSLSGDAAAAVQHSLRPQGDRRLKCAAATDSVPARATGHSPSADAASRGWPLYLPGNGDLVILLNPAFEASRFANLNEMKSRTFHPCQVPLLVTLASESDTAVGVAFRVGQSVTRDRSPGVGMYAPYHTHHLTPRETPATPPALVDGTDPRTCACETDFRTNGDALIDQLRPLYKRLAEAPHAGIDGPEFTSSLLSPLADVDPNIPFMTVQVDRRIMAGHNDIFNSRILGFMLELVARAEYQRRSTIDEDRPVK